MIYVDQVFHALAQDREARRVGAKHGHRWSHMWCDPGEEEQLHAMAARIGLRRRWFQDKPGFPHYDLVPTRRHKAVKYGALERDLRDWLRYGAACRLL